MTSNRRNDRRERQAEQGDAIAAGPVLYQALHRGFEPPAESAEAVDQSEAARGRRPLNNDDAISQKITIVVSRPITAAIISRATGPPAS
jgi:hypothetical protein